MFHVAGIHNSRQIVRGTASFGVRRLIVVHTTGIYSRYKKAGEEYRRIRGDVERIRRENGMALPVLRPTMIYGNLSDNNIRVFTRMSDRLPLMPIVNGGIYELQPVHYDDLADAYYLTLMNEASTAGRNFAFSGGEALSFRDMMTEIGRLLGKDMRFIGTGQGASVPELLETFSRVNGVKVPHVISARRKGDIPVCYANADKAFAALGWRSTRTLEDMCRDVWRWKCHY